MKKNQFTKIKTCSDDDTPDDNGETDKKLSLFQYDEEVGNCKKIFNVL